MRVARNLVKHKITSMNNDMNVTGIWKHSSAACHICTCMKLQILIDRTVVPGNIYTPWKVFFGIFFFILNLLLPLPQPTSLPKPFETAPPPPPPPFFLALGYNISLNSTLDV